jgi:hypothetical protein
MKMMPPPRFPRRTSSAYLLHDAPGLAGPGAAGEYSQHQVTPGPGFSVRAGRKKAADIFGLILPKISAAGNTNA